MGYVRDQKLEKKPLNNKNICFISIPSENVRKSLVVWRFQGVRKSNIGLQHLVNIFIFDYVKL